MLLKLTVKSLPQRVQANWQISLLVLMLLPLLISLGNWQLSRAEEKQQLQAVYQQQRNLPAVSLDQLNPDADNLYRYVVVRGSFDKDRYWLLDNRSLQGKSGYEVIMPLVSADTSILVNRGWIAAPDRRESLPSILIPEGELTIRGYLYSGDANALIKHSASDLQEEWPKRVLQLNAEAAERALGEQQFPLMLRIDADSPGSFWAHWKIVNSGPEKHRAYAVQWFAMALALIVLYGYLLTRKAN